MEKRCKACLRPLRSFKSQRAGYGRLCFKRNKLALKDKKFREQGNRLLFDDDGNPWNEPKKSKRTKTTRKNAGTKNLPV